GGHDSQKIYNAYHRAIQANGRPTVILAKTIKGYGMGDAGEARNFTHQQKKLDENQLIYVRNRFNVPITDEQAMKCTFLKPPDDSPEMQYMHARRQALGGYLPAR